MRMPTVASGDRGGCCHAEAGEQHGSGEREVDRPESPPRPESDRHGRVARYRIDRHEAVSDGSRHDGDRVDGQRDDEVRLRQEGDAERGGEDGEEAERRDGVQQSHGRQRRTAQPCVPERHPADGQGDDEAQHVSR